MHTGEKGFCRCYSWSFVSCECASKLAAKVKDISKSNKERARRTSKKSWRKMLLYRTNS